MRYMAVVATMIYYITIAFPRCRNENENPFETFDNLNLLFGTFGNLYKRYLFYFDIELKSLEDTHK